MALLEVENLKKQFDRTEVLRGVSFTLDEGQTLSVIGSSGGGKTTLLRCLNFLEIPTSGRILLNGESLFDSASGRRLTEREIRSHRLHFGLVFQNFNLFPQYTALGNVSLALRLQAKERPDFKENRKQILSGIEANCTELLKRVGLGDRLDRYPHQLSGGQQQRVAIARALALRPEVLFFDEPTSALDPELTGGVLRVIRQLAEEKMTMVIVTHEMAFSEAVSDQVMFIDAGLIVEKGTPEQLFRHPSEERTQRFLRGYERGAESGS